MMKKLLQGVLCLGLACLLAVSMAFAYPAAVRQDCEDMINPLEIGIAVDDDC